MGLQVIPMWMVKALGPGLSQDRNMGRVIAEQILRDDNSSLIIIELCGEPKGTKVGQRAMHLPPLQPGVSWDFVADKLRDGAVNSGGYTTPYDAEEEEEDN